MKISVVRHRPKDPQRPELLGVAHLVVFISCFPVGYRKIAVKIFFDLTLVAPVKISIVMFLLSRLIARAS